MKPDISSLSLLELEELKGEAQSIIEARKAQLFDETYQQIMQLVEPTGLSLEELVARAQKKPIAKTRKPVPPRYRNPHNSQETWTGRGKQPRWLAAQIAAGAQLEDFLIDAT